MRGDQPFFSQGIRIAFAAFYLAGALSGSFALGIPGFALSALGALALAAPVAFPAGGALLLLAGELFFDLLVFLPPLARGEGPSVLASWLGPASYGVGLALLSFEILTFVRAALPEVPLVDPTNRRRSHRVPVQAGTGRVRFQGVERECRVLDISHDGLSFELPEGEGVPEVLACEVEFHLGNLELRVPAEVVHSGRMGPRTYGVRFAAVPREGK